MQKEHIEKVIAHIKEDSYGEAAKVQFSFDEVGTSAT
jgi:hypothetical protein